MGDKEKMWLRVCQQNFPINTNKSRSPLHLRKLQDMNEKEEDRRNTEFHEVVRKGDSSKLLEFVCYNGADEINVRNKAGWSPLHIAVNSNNSSLVSTLLQYGSDPNQPNSSMNTALHLAVKKRNLEDQPLQENIKIVTALLEAGAKTTERDGVTKETASEMVKSWKREELYELFSLPKDGESTAAELKRKKLLQTLKELGGSGSGTPTSPDDQIPLVHKSLLKNDITKTRQLQLQAFVTMGEDDVVKELLGCEEVDVNGLGINLTLLQGSLVSENWSTAQILLDNGADPNIYQKGLEASPFAIAMKHRKWKLAETILQRLTSCDLVLLELVLSLNTDSVAMQESINVLKLLIDKIFKIDQLNLELTSD